MRGAMAQWIKLKNFWKIPIWNTVPLTQWGDTNLERDNPLYFDLDFLHFLQHQRVTFQLTFQTSTHQGPTNLHCTLQAVKRLNYIVFNFPHRLLCNCFTEKKNLLIFKFNSRPMILLFTLSLNSGDILGNKEFNFNRLCSKVVCSLC